MNANYSKIKGKKVLLYSGGMDSYIISRLEQPDVLLFINNNSSYSDTELLKLPRLDNLVILDDFINMKDLERDDYIIPSRNAYFILRAAEYGDNIILGATSGDRSTDKDKKFAKIMTDLLNHIYEKSHWCVGRNIKVDLKYKDYTKRDLICSLVEKNMNDHHLSLKDAREFTVEELYTNSSSCYDYEDGRECGICKPCLRKWLSILSATEIDSSEYYTNSPREYFTKDRINEWIRRESGSNNRGRESIEIINTLKSL